MIEAYRIGASLILESNSIQMLPRIADAFEALDRVIDAAKAKVSEFGKELRSLGGAGKAIRQISESLDAMPRSLGQFGEASNKASLAIDGLGQHATQAADKSKGAWEAAAQAIRSFNDAAGSARLPAPAVIPAPPASENRAASPKMAKESGSFSLLGAVGSALSVGSGYAFLKGNFDISAQKSSIENQMAKTIWTPKQIKEAEAKAIEAQRLNVGITINDALQAFGELGTFTGNPEEALALGMDFVKLQVSLQQNGHGGEMQELTDAMQTAELKGVMQDPEKLKTFLHSVAAIDAATMHRVGPHALLAMMRSGGISSAMLSDPGQTHMIAPILALGPERAGTALQGMQIQFGSGKMSIAAARELADMGVLKKGHWHPAGMGMVWIDHNSLNGVDMLKDPVTWVHDKLMPKIQAFDRAHVAGYDKMSDTDKLAIDTQEAQRVASRIPGGRFLGEIMRVWPLILKYDQMLSDVSGKDFFATSTTGNPEKNASGFVAALKGLEEGLGDAMMPAAIAALNGLTVALNGLANFARNNHQISKTLTALGVGGTVGAAVGFLFGGPGGAAVGAAGVAATAGVLGILLDPPTGPDLSHVTNDPVGSKIGLHARKHSWITNEPVGARLKRLFHGISYDDSDGGVTVNIHPAAVYLDGRKVGEIIFDHAGRSRPQQGTTGFDRRVTPIFPGQMATA